MKADPAICPAFLGKKITDPQRGPLFFVPKAGLEPALLSEKHFECSASAISPLRLN